MTKFLVASVIGFVWHVVRMPYRHIKARDKFITRFVALILLIKNLLLPSAFLILFLRITRCSMKQADADVEGRIFLYIIVTCSGH